MPSYLHEALVLLFRNQPQLAPDLLREGLNMVLPPYREARVVAADLSDVQPTAYRADSVIVLRREAPVLGIVVEVQMQRSVEKRYVWPMYVVSLRARLRCPVYLLVLTPRDDVARWASRPIDLGAGNSFTPLVVGPKGVPIVSERRLARRDPELAVLSAIAHGRTLASGDAARLAGAAIAATERLDAERSAMYFDIILASLGEAARKELQAMEPGKYEYQSAFAKRYFGKGLAEGEAKGLAEGRAEGEARGKIAGAAEVVLRLLRRRFGELSRGDIERVRNASIADLDRFADRLLTATKLADVWGAANGAKPRTRRRKIG